MWRSWKETTLWEFYQNPDPHENHPPPCVGRERVASIKILK